MDDKGDKKKNPNYSRKSKSYKSVTKFTNPNPIH